jgi:hypothetical protein
VRVNDLHNAGILPHGLEGFGAARKNSWPAVKSTGIRLAHQEQMNGPCCGRRRAFCIGVLLMAGYRWAQR